MLNDAFAAKVIAAVNSFAPNDYRSEMLLEFLELRRLMARGEWDHLKSEATRLNGITYSDFPKL